MIFIAPPNDGLITIGQPEPSGLADRVSLGRLGDMPLNTTEPSWETLRKSSELPDFDAYGIPQEAIRAFYIAMGNFIMADAHGFWLEPDAGDGHCDPQRFVVEIGQRISELGNLWNGNDIESPIEAQLGSALLWLNIDWAGFPKADQCGFFDRRKEAGSCDGVEFWLTPQAEIGSYKVDFLLWFAFKKIVGGIAIECDGHDFHEKTKEQAARDKKRDREILGAGFPVMRFSGSEIFRDAHGCAAQVKEIAADILYRISKEGGMFQ